ncbi:2-dehydropantoate 2-reductase [Lentibacillus halodurans]|uniref:2-dehydropantoate 2-reductase n=1 Tax=Lentibacillus halodurans TaxID=237679 RepID=A0A1I0ZB69_9BACI|nr:2-dehydropantoate 2-reductase [Lentibacillus halodurans]SFB22607.1 2-dehydropantoate 2-reductase [Lentibacillus halodurans]
MKIGVAGAGAVGSFFGALLHQGGHDVTFLARGEQLEVLNQQGLVIQGESENIRIGGEFTGDPYELAQSDLILFCVKSNDTEQMAKQLHPILKEDALVITLQNGVDNEGKLQEIFGANRVLSAATYVQVSMKVPGQVYQRGRVKLVIGELIPRASRKAKKITEEIRSAGIDTQYSGNILERKWQKLLWNITFNPLSATIEAKLGEILDSAPLRKTAENICREALATVAATGITIDQEKAFSTIFSNAELARSHRTSMLQDRQRGKKMEVESMCGYVVRKARELGVPAPTLETIYYLLTFMNERNQ